MDADQSGRGGVSQGRSNSASDCDSLPAMAPPWLTPSGDALGEAVVGVLFMAAALLLWAAQQLARRGWRRSPWYGVAGLVLVFVIATLHSGEVEEPLVGLAATVLFFTASLAAVTVTIAGLMSRNGDIGADLAEPRVRLQRAKSLGIATEPPGTTRTRWKDSGLTRWPSLSWSHRQAWEPLRRGWRYRVVRAFTDEQGIIHPPGEEWIYRGYSYLPYDAGLTLFVKLSGDDGFWGIRLCGLDPDQRDVMDRTEKYLARP